MIPEVADLLDEAVRAGTLPAYAACVIHRGQPLHASSGGEIEGGPSTLATWFDLASLTKPLATGLAALRLAGQGRLDLDAPVARHLPGFEQAGKAALRPCDLLDHSSGLPAWRPYFRGVTPSDASALRPPPSLDFARARAQIAAAVDAEPLERAPGVATLYSDVGFLALGRLVEAVACESLPRFVQREVFERLGIRNLAFFDLAAAGVPAGRPIAATGSTRPRPPAAGQETALEGLPIVAVGARPGEVDDDNAYACGGVAGHAGLFGTTAAVAKLGQLFLEELEGAARLAPERIARRFEQPANGRERPLAWDRPSAKGSSLGTKLGRGPRGAIGHLGFTGCSLWIDLDERLVAVLCTNRVLANRAPGEFQQLRALFHDTVALAIL